MSKPRKKVEKVLNKMSDTSMTNITKQGKCHVTRSNFLATCNATNVALQVARENSRVTPHFATAIVALRVARKVE